MDCKKHYGPHDSSDNFLISYERIIIFGSSITAKRLVKELINLAIPHKIVVVLDRPMLWANELIKDSSKNLQTFVIKEHDEFKREDLYLSIDVRCASNIVILTEEKEMTQAIIDNVFKMNRDVNITILDKYAPDFMNIIGTTLKNISIVDDVNAVKEDIVKVLNLNVTEATAIFIPALPEFLGKRGIDMECILKGSSVMKILRSGTLIDPRTKLQMGDKLLIIQKGKLGFYQLTKVYADKEYSQSLKKVYLGE